MNEENDKDGGLKDAKSRILLTRKRYAKTSEADRDNRQMFTDDMKFALVPGEQWDAFSKRERGDDRPMYEFNRTRTTIKRVVNSMRNNPVAGKVRAVEDGDKETADIYEGLIRNIANTSNFDSIRDNAAEYQVTGGYAAWRIATKYSDDAAFDDQDLLIEGLRNPLCLYCDPNAFEQTGRDATYWILTDKIPKETFNARYPKASPIDFENVEFDDDDDWDDGDKVRIAEHWYQVPVDKSIYLLSDGRTIGSDDLDEARTLGLSIIKERTVRCYDIYSAIYSGNAELSPPAKWPGKYFPWVRVFGEYIIIDGKVYWCGLTRHVKDAQRSFNVSQTSVAETIARAPLSQVWATAEQAKGLSKHWAEASRTNRFAQIYNADPKAPGPPVRIGGAEVPVAAMQNAQMMGDEIKADSGIFDASLGQQSNETSGRAINARQAQGELATFNYPANMANAIKRTWEILVDLIPKVIDTPRALRILGSDDADKYVRVNNPDANGNIINDLSRGKFDVVVTIGSSYSTRRQEAVDAYSEMGKSNPALMAVASDLIIKGMDLPYSDEISERIRATMPPQIQALMNKETKQSPEVQHAMQLADQAMQEVQQQGQMVQAAAQEAQTEKAAADKAKADNQITLANIKVAEANLATSEAQFKQLVAETQAKMAGDQQGNDAVNERESLSAELQQALAGIQQQAAELGGQYAQLFTQLANKEVAPPTVVVADPPKQKIVRVSRTANGELVGMIEEVAAQPSATIQ
jgi:hypothetical protein